MPGNTYEKRTGRRLKTPGFLQVMVDREIPRCGRPLQTGRSRPGRPSESLNWRTHSPPSCSYHFYISEYNVPMIIAVLIGLFSSESNSNMFAHEAPASAC